MKKSTPGPWHVGIPDHSIRLNMGVFAVPEGPEGPEPWDVAHVDGVENARLVAAAPDLLAACHSALIWLRECRPGTAQAEIADELRAAIALAEKGRAS